MATGDELAIRPVRPDLRVTVEPSTISVTASDVRSHRSVCQRPSLYRRELDTSTCPDDPRNQHWMMPDGIWTFHEPPATVACPFWTTLPKYPVVRNRSMTA